MELIKKVREEFGLGNNPREFKINMQKRYKGEEAEYRFGVKDFESKLKLVVQAIKSGRILLE